jgi:hypothetical protein
MKLVAGILIAVVITILFIKNNDGPLPAGSPEPNDKIAVAIQHTVDYMSEKISQHIKP